MIFTEKIFNAIIFATEVHRTQIRKGKPDIPYITHPLAVGLILARLGADEDVIVAGILHDTIEDCIPYGSITKEHIAKEFGNNVAVMVNDVTEQDKKLPHEVRKKLALEHIKKMSQDSLKVKSADQLYNMTDLISDYKKEGDKMFKHFNADKKDQLKRYQKLIPEIEKAWNKNPLLPDLKSALQEIVTLWS